MDNKKEENRVWRKRFDKALQSNSRADFLYGHRDRDGDDRPPSREYHRQNVRQRESNFRPKRNTRRSPNAFICFRVLDRSTIANCTAVQTDIAQKDRRLSNAMIPVAKLHCTLRCLRLRSEEDLWHVQHVLRELQALLVSLFPLGITVNLEGVAHFGHRVIVAKVKDSSPLTTLVNAISSRLDAAGIELLGNYTPYVPYVTLCKVAFKKSFDDKILLDYAAMNLGTQWLCGIDLCPIGGSVKMLDGSYPVFYHIPNVNPSLDEGPIQVHRGLLVVLRGVAGSGKSTIARLLQSQCDRQNLSSRVCTSEAFYLEKGSCFFDEVQMEEPSDVCHKNVIKTLQAAIDVVIADNAHLDPLEITPYIDAAISMGYEVIVVEIQAENILACLRRSHRRVMLTECDHDLHPLLDDNVQIVKVSAYQA
ncbi:hypothetical protein THRCLA_22239 [Thraustotheca clavata]|uniref:A-kinase anchor protein 7-like phosphoesterase domain-containing protein n=1 Tax=Thraustotheca clavata TaxID=74557 RepID=A0A1V9Z8R5_9STRA|nr:hypothetical protein THRCLA_22239 [Thraustotheca clavata]